MATTSEVITGLDEISKSISANKRKYENSLSNLSAASNALGAITTTYLDVRTTIEAYGDADAFEVAKKAELAKLVTEFQDLKATIDAAITAIG